MEKTIDSNHPELDRRPSDPIVRFPSFKHESEAVSHSPDTETAPLEKLESIQDVPPDGGYGWVCTVCVSGIQANTWGVNSAYAVFLAYYLQNNVYAGASDLTYAFIGGLSVSQALLLSPIATTTTRLYGTKVTMCIGIFFETLALIGASFTKVIWQLILSQGFCFGWGMGFLFTASVGILPQWFTTKRGLTNGIAASGSGLGALTYALAADAMIRSIGVEWAFRVLAICTFSCNTIFMILVKDRNKQIKPNQKAFDVRLLKRPEYLLLLGWGCFSLLGYVVLLFSLPAFGRSIGLSYSQAALLSALYNLGQAIGRSSLGWISDRVGRIDTAMYASAASAVVVFAVWIPANGYGVSVFFSLLVGLISGSFWGVVPTVSGQVVGLKQLPAALGLQWLFLSIPTLIAEPIALELRTDGGQNFRHVQIYTGFMYIGACMCAWALRAWKVGQMECEEQKARRDGQGAATPSEKSSFVKRLFLRVKV